MNSSIPITQSKALKVLLALAFTASCSSGNNDYSFDEIYRKEVEMVVDNVRAKGVFVAPKRALYKLKFELPDKPNIVKLTTCHREETFKDVGKKLEYDYRPVPGLEDTGSCLLEMGAFDDEGAHLWGLIDFEDIETLPAVVGCNGLTMDARGASICQSKAGLIQQISFKRTVRALTTQECPKPDTKDDLVFTYIIAQDKCLYLFSDGTSEHRHTSFGYNEVLL